MAIAKHWTIDIYIDEHEEERRTRAEARLSTNDATHLVGRGSAQRNPHDLEIPEIGDELAVARALGELAHMLLESAAADIEQVTAVPVRLRS